ncbi:hypothetical protein J6590_074618 [Homalodisca vitripennis]|nr:hypothetical protein J6590_074618 [Homalodisca vitripennis]
MILSFSTRSSSEALIARNYSTKSTSIDTFARLYYSTTYQQQSTIPRLLRSGNEMGHLVDFFATSPARFREEIIKLVYGTL